MKKVRKEKIKEEQTIYEFYCDKCNKHIITSIEYDDGYFEEPEYIDCQIFLNNEWYNYEEKCLCDDCKEKEIFELINKLKKIGFKSEVE